jgi:hypothetical protein
MATSTIVARSTSLCDNLELLLPLTNNVGCNTGITTIFVIRIYVNPFESKDRQVTPDVTYQHEFLQSADINHHDCIDQQRQEWIDIWKQIEAIDTTMQESFEDKADEIVTSVSILSLLFSFFLRAYHKARAEDMLFFNCITVTVWNVYCCIKHKIIVCYMQSILFITLIAIILVYRLANLLFGGTVTLLFSFIHLCIQYVTIYWRYLALKDKVLQKVYYEIKNVSRELKYFTLQPKVGFYFFNITVDIYIKDSGSPHLLSAITTQRKQEEKSPNISDFGVHDPLIS